MAVADINEAGGIDCLDGAELRLETGDSEGAAATGQSEAQRLDRRAAPRRWSAPTRATSRRTSPPSPSAAGVPLVIDVAVDDAILEQGYKNTFRIQPNATSMGTDGAEALLQAAEQNGEQIDSVSYIHVEGAFGQSVFDAFAATAEENGVEVLEEVTYSPRTSPTPPLSCARRPRATRTSSWRPATTPTACSSPRPCEQLGPDIQGLYGIANGAFDNGPFPDDAGRAGEEVLSANYHYDATTSGSPTSASGSSRSTTSPWRRLPSSPTRPSRSSRPVSRSRAPTTRMELRDAIADVEIDDSLLAFDGPITFDETGQNENATVIVMQVLDGKIEQVFPEEFTTADLVYPATR